MIRSGPRSAGQELWLTLLLGAAGAGLAFLATRQGWAQVRTTPPRPLPASRIAVTGASLAPYADALVIAGLATLAAVLATRGLLRRLAGVLLAALGAGTAAAAFTVTKAAAIAAASVAANPSTAAAGSVTDGSAPASSVPDVAGTAPHVLIAAAGWQALLVAGAAAMVAAGILVICRGTAMAVMSSRYDAPTGPSSNGAPEAPSSRRSAVAAPPDAASMWEALSRGEDPT